MFIYLRKHREKILLALIVVTYTTIFSALSIVRHNAFASGFDLGNMDQTVWNTLHGRFFVFTGDTGTVSRFSIHGDLILALLAPVFLLWDNVRMLLIVQSLFIGLSAVPIYLLGKNILKDARIAYILACVFLLAPGVEWTNIYDFHPSALAIFFFLSAFYCMWVKKWRWFVLFIFLFLICKETTALTVAAMGFLMMVFLKERKKGFITMIVGAVWFVMMVKIIIPAFSPSHTYWALSWAQNISETEHQQISNVNWQNILSKFLLAPDAKNYFNQLLKPYFYLPIFGFPWILMILPRLAVNLISTQGQMRSIYFHYDSVIQAGLIIATIFALRNGMTVMRNLKPSSQTSRRVTLFVVVSVLIVAVRVNYHYSPLPITPSCWCISYKPTWEDIQFDALLQTIPVSSSISASPEIRPHLTHRENIYTLPIATASADFVAIIDQNRILGNYDPKDFELRLKDTLDQEGKYALLKHIGHFYLYKKK